MDGDPCECSSGVRKIEADRKQGHDPNDYAYTYLFTAARFFNYQSNPVSIWNLYSVNKELTAVVLEVNNTFEERHIYLMKPQSTPLPEDLNIKPPRFSGKFQKEFYVSTFNSRLGHYSISTSDALFPHMRTANPLPVNTTIGLCSSSGRPKLIARIFSTGPAVDPSTLSLFGKISFLSKWWWVGFLTIPRTLYQAWILFFNKKISWSFRPEPRASTMCRPATTNQIFVKNIFRRYLRYVISSFPGTIQVKYIPAGIHPVETETMKFDKSSNEGVEVEIRILTPLFYTRLLHYTSLSEALLGESQEGNQTVSISNLKLASKFFPPNETSASLLSTTTPLWQRGAFILLNAISVPAPPIENCETGPENPPRYVAKSSTSWGYEIQDFLQSRECTDSERNEWLLQAGKLFLAHHLTLGSVDLLDLLVFGWKAVISWGVVKRVFA